MMGKSCRGLQDEKFFDKSSDRESGVLQSAVIFMQSC